MDQLSRKLSTKQLGLFPIIQKVSKVVYKLKIPSTWKSIYPIVNEPYLTSYIKPNNNHKGLIIELLLP